MTEALWALVGVVAGVILTTISSWIIANHEHELSMLRDEKNREAEKEKARVEREVAEEKARVEKEAGERNARVSRLVQDIDKYNPNLRRLENETIYKKDSWVESDGFDGIESWADADFSEYWVDSDGSEYCGKLEQAREETKKNILKNVISKIKSWFLSIIRRPTDENWD